MWAIIFSKNILSIFGGEYEVAKNSNLLVVVTEWNQFKNLDLLKVKKIMKKPVILDLRNIYSKQITKNGFQYYSVGNN